MLVKVALYVVSDYNRLFECQFDLLSQCNQDAARVFVTFEQKKRASALSSISCIPGELDYDRIRLTWHSIHVFCSIRLAI